eukprot:TRINITY_DN16168_c0_g1_i1.p1 TRINITY_DN16168_c0_g1~~TRINITY_DN16168_c0_g1_i1.p1  ORF type:complete len:107 (+),score=3.19 TRINITY_DN16168_c0_g1_i1:110-430(+)
MSDHLHLTRFSLRYHYVIRHHYKNYFYSSKTLSIAVTMLYIFFSVSTYPSPLLLLCTNFPATSTSNFTNSPVFLGVPWPDTTKPGNSSSSSCLRCRNLRAYPHPLQ